MRRVRPGKDQQLLGRGVSLWQEVPAGVQHKLEVPMGFPDGSTFSWKNLTKENLFIRCGLVSTLFEEKN